MPQMAPNNWLFLFLMFNFIMLLFISYINFFYCPHPMINKINKIKKFLLKW